MWQEIFLSFMKAVLFDRSVSGHRIDYVKYISKIMLRNGDEVVFITSEESERLSQLTDLGVCVEVLPNYRYNSSILPLDLVKRTKFIKKCFSEAKNRDADLLHDLFFDESELLYLILYYMKIHPPVPLYVTLFNPTYTEPGRSPLRTIFRSTSRYASENLFKYRYFEKVFVHNRRIKEQLVSTLKIDPSIANVVPDPIDPPIDETPRSNAREALDLPNSNETIFLFFGGLRYDKGIDILLEAIINRNDERITFVIAGQPGYVDGEQLETIRNKLENPNTVVLETRFIPDEKVHQYFFASDAVILPYRSDYVGTSNILQQSIATKRPVIATDTGVVGSIVSEWELGVVVQPDSPSSINRGISEYIDMKSKIDANVQEKADEYISQHHWEVFGKIVRQTYLESV